MLNTMRRALNAIGLGNGLDVRLRTPILVEAVLLDLDGTLVDSAPDLVAAANTVRTEMGLEPLSFDTLVSYVGKGAEVLIHRTLTGQMDGRADGAALTRGMAIFSRVYQEINGDQTTVFAGARAGLEMLVDKGIPLALVTNKPAQFTEPLLLKKSLLNFFDVIVCGDTCKYKKPHPEPLLHACRELKVKAQAALAIGDSHNDSQAARAAGIRILAVPYGYNEGAASSSLDVDGVVPTLAHGARLIERAASSS